MTKYKYLASSSIKRRCSQIGNHKYVQFGQTAVCLCSFQRFYPLMFNVCTRESLAMGSVLGLLNTTSEHSPPLTSLRASLVSGDRTSAPHNIDVCGCVCICMDQSEICRIPFIHFFVSETVTDALISLHN